MGELIKKGLFKTDDWLAVWLGFLIIVLVLIGARPKMPTFKWTTYGEFNAIVAESKPTVEKFIKDTQTKGEAELFASAMALKTAIGTGDRAAIQNAAYLLFGGFIFPAPVIR